MLKLNPMDAQRLLYKLGVSFYNSEIVYRRHGKSRQVIGLRIWLTEWLPDAIIKLLQQIDGFEHESPQRLLFKTAAEIKRLQNCDM